MLLRHCLLSATNASLLCLISLLHLGFEIASSRIFFSMMVRSRAGVGGVYIAVQLGFELAHLLDRQIVKERRWCRQR